MTATAKAIDAKKYGRLLSRMLPSVIETEKQNELMLEQVNKLMSKGEDKLSPEEGKLLKLMVYLIEDFEERAYAIPDAPPHKVLQHLMEQRDMKQSELLSIFGSRGYISDIVNGKRGISKEYAKALGELFHVSPALFL